MVRREVVVSLGLIRGDARDMIPVLLAVAKKDGDVHTRIRAVAALGGYGPEAQVAIPDLVALMKEPAGQGSDVGSAATGALMKVGPAGMPALAEVLADKNARTRALAAEALGNMGEPARSALPRLEGLLKDPDGNVRVVAALAVWKLDPGRAADTVAVLTEGLKRKDKWSIRLDSVVKLAQMGQAAKQAIPALTDMLKDIHGDIRQGAARALAEMGPEARSAVPALEEMAAKDTEVGSAAAAKAALEKLRAETATAAKP
jgi:HEAT repeat protein